MATKRNIQRKPVFEIVTVDVQLAKRATFHSLHRNVLMKACRRLGIEVMHCLMVEVGSVGQVIDIYQFDSYESYERLSTRLEKALLELGYYKRIQECITGSIRVSLAQSLL